MSELDRVRSSFARIWAGPPTGIWKAPGRVNLIGEHTDYNEGFVLPFAIGNGITVAARAGSERTLRVASEPYGTAEWPLDSDNPEAEWIRYPLAALRVLEEQGVKLKGLDLVIESSLPEGAGLSSSAALICAVMLVVVDLAEISIPREELALLAQRAETEYVGVPVGVMDQMASMCATADHLMFLDCRSMQYEWIDCYSSRSAVTLLVIDTGVHRRLVTGEYAQRRRSCEIVAEQLGVRSLRDATIEMIESIEPGEPEASRARHVVTENQRVLETVERLRRGSFEDIGDLLDASHRSLAVDYEVSSPELDLAVDAAREAGALGARMTGAGFGGCALALIATGRAEAAKEAIRLSFTRLGWAEPKFIDVWPSRGAVRLA